MVLPQAMAWVHYWFRVLSLKFCGKSKKICGDISQQSPAFCMYGFVTFIFLPTTQPLFPLDTSCVIFFVIWFVSFLFLLTNHFFLLKQFVLITKVFFYLVCEVIYILFAIFHQQGSHEFPLKQFATGRRKQICLIIGKWAPAPWRKVCFYDPWKMIKRG